MFDRYSVVDMFGPIYGENWHQPELHDGLTFRWSYADLETTLLVPTLGAPQVRFRLVLARLPDLAQLDKMDFTIDGRPATLRWSMKGPHVALWTDVIFERGVRSARIKFVVPPRAMQSSMVETRLLGLGVNRVEIFALEEEAIGLQNQALQEQLREARLALESPRKDNRVSVKEKVAKALRYRGS